MHITDGTRIGSYEIIDSLGAGGMGNVYRASDLRLGREVAIKTLAENIATDQEALARFEREARFLAALNHPNIASIYGIEEYDGERFLVLELVGGETLDTIVPVPLDRALAMAIDIASALDAAHGAGIVHRDLKPSNVKITQDGRVKLLDFGIAKNLMPAAGDLSNAATVESDLTRAGTSVGTPAYMSPEQIRGADVDRQTDVWAFGCLLYEMLSGRRAFNGRTYLDLADAIRNTEPDWSVLPRNTPERLRRIIAHCIKKDPHDRTHSMSDVRVELQEIANERTGRGSSLNRSTRLGVVAALVAAVLVVLAVVLWRNPPRRQSASLAPRLTQLTFAEGVEEFPAWSRDGASLVYSGEVGGVRKLFLKRIGSNDDRQLTFGDYDDLQPAWSADGKRILFVRGREPKRRIEPGDVFSYYESSSGDLWSIDVASRHETRLVESAFSPAVSPDGKSIAVDGSWAGPRRIWLIDANGLNPQQLTTESSEAVVHLLPQWSPDGKKIVYQRIERTKFDIAAVDVTTRQSIVVTNDAYRKINPAWSPSGRFIYFSSDRGGGMNVWRVAVALDGKPTDRPQQVTTGAGQDVQIAIAHDGKRLAYATLRQNADLWRLPLRSDGTAAGSPQPLIATTREDSRGAWAADATMIAFNSDRSGDMNIWVQSLSDGATRQITRGPGGDFQPNWSPDGRRIAFFSSRSGNADIWKADVATGALTQLTHARSLDINPFFSPDGSQIAYQSDASGRLELWLMRSDGSQQRQRTTIGASGHFMRWLGDGFIYFRSSGTGVMRVRPAAGDPELVSKNGGAHISFSPDGSKFIDVTGHKVLWLYGRDGSSKKLFAFDDTDVRIDYPVWSPDGKWLLFDRFKPEGGDIWLAEDIE